MFEVPHEHALKLSSAMAVGISNSLQQFRTTQQPLKNFTVVVENSEETEVVLVSFVAKREPGKKGLGSTNSKGRGVSYRVRRDSGEVVGEFFSK